MSATLGSGSSSGSQCRDDVRIVIIGAGFGGLLAALRLKKKLGFENFVVRLSSCRGAFEVLTGALRSTRRAPTSVELGGSVYGR